MPALLTHAIFGEKTLPVLESFVAPTGVVTCEQREAFILGCQGPDPLFFHIRGRNAKRSSRIGHLMHVQQMTEAFTCMRSCVDRFEPRDAGIAQAFALGWLAHYTLDVHAHPFVYAQQYALCQAHEDLTNAGSAVHAVIESDLDIQALYRFHKGETIESNPAYPHIVMQASSNVLRIASQLVAWIAKEVYEENLSFQAYASSVHDMRLIYRIIDKPHSKRAVRVGKLERMVKEHSILSSLAHFTQRGLVTPVANTTRTTWENPFTHQTSNASFWEIFDRAATVYPRNAHIFLTKGDMRAITKHTNYNGQPLSELEICTSPA